MAVATLRVVRAEARSISVLALALAHGDATGNTILALELGRKTGWMVRNPDGTNRFGGTQ